MAEAPNFDDRDSFEAWLMGHDDETTLAYAQVLSGRVALRVVPYLADIWSTGADAKIKSDLTLHSLRANLISAVARKYPTAEMRRAARSAADSADSAAVSAAVSAADSAADSAAVSAAASADSAAASADSAAVSAAGFAALSADTAAVFAAESAIWESVLYDAMKLFDGMSIEDLEGAQRLWLNQTPKWFMDAHKRLAQTLDDDGLHWDFWLDWYDAKVTGKPMARLSVKGEDAIGQWLGEQDDAFWERGAEAVGADIEAWIGEWVRENASEALKRARVAQRKLLAKTASPSYAITPDGLLDAVPNSDTDQPVSDAELLNLPQIQRSLINLIKRLLKEKNAPQTPIAILDAYQDEIDARGVSVIMGILDNSVLLMQLEMSKEFCGPWKDDETISGALEQFFKTHEKIKQHFPFDNERLAALDNADIDVEAALEAGLLEALNGFAGSVQEAEQDGIVTENLRRIEESRVRHAQDVFSAPVPERITDGPPELIARQEDRILQVEQARKRTVASLSGSADAILDKAEKAASFADTSTGKLLIGGASGLVKVIWRGVVGG